MLFYQGLRVLGNSISLGVVFLKHGAGVRTRRRISIPAIDRGVLSLGACSVGRAIVVRVSWDRMMNQVYQLISTSISCSCIQYRNALPVPMSKRRVIFHAIIRRLQAARCRKGLPLAFFEDGQHVVTTTMLLHQR